MVWRSIVVTLIPPPPPAEVPSWPLAHAGPAQHDVLIHFCGRSPMASMTRWVPGNIANMEPAQRLDNILWDEQLRGFPPFCAEPDQPMVCLSESPPDHLRWLLSTRKWPPWGLIFRRQTVYDIGGGPAWHVRTEQFGKLPREHLRWAVRLDTTPKQRSDWLYEREWRIPLPASDPALTLTPDNLVGVLVGDPRWKPSRRPVETGMHIDASNGELAYPGDLYAVPDVRPSLPWLWNEATYRISWDPAGQKFASVE